MIQKSPEINVSKFIFRFISDKDEDEPIPELPENLKPEVQSPVSAEWNSLLRFLTDKYTVQKIQFCTVRWTPFLERFFKIRTHFLSSIYILTYIYVLSLLLVPLASLLQMCLCFSQLSLRSREFVNNSLHRGTDSKQLSLDKREL